MSIDEDFALPAIKELQREDSTCLQSSKKNSIGDDDDACKVLFSRAPKQTEHVPVFKKRAYSEPTYLSTQTGARSIFNFLKQKIQEKEEVSPNAN